MLENKVAKSGLITLDAEEYLDGIEFGELDLAPFLWQGMAVKEKEFRAAILDFDWNDFEGKVVAIYCSEDAIIPHWAYMLIGTSLSGIAKEFHFCNPNKIQEYFILNVINEINPANYLNQRVIVKGCGNFDFTPAIYLKFTEKLKPVVRSLMFGEPCSTVPVFKQKNPS